MAALDDPEEAFSASGHRLQAGSGWLQLYRLDESLRGFEMLIASSNNRAVENVSAELPSLAAVAEDAPDLRYFKPLADGLLQAESWGAIAAVLGNGSNRAAFKDRFWWNVDTGLFAYLKAVDGRGPEVEDTDGGKRPPVIVTEMDPPVDRRDALRRWQAGRRGTALRPAGDSGILAAFFSGLVGLISEPLRRASYPSRQCSTILHWTSIL